MKNFKDDLYKTCKTYYYVSSTSSYVNMQMHGKDSGKISNKWIVTFAFEWSLEVLVNREFSPILNAFTL